MVAKCNIIEFVNLIIVEEKITTLKKIDKKNENTFRYGLLFVYLPTNN
jgi:hypothetical protein